VTSFNHSQLKEDGFFFFISQDKWALTEQEKLDYKVKNLQKRRSKG